METSADEGTMVQADALANASGAAMPSSHPQPAALVRVRGRDRGQRHGSDGRDDRQRRRPVDPAALGGSASTLQWLSAGYTLAFAVFLITGARLGDMFGRRRLFLIGSAGFTVMSAACAAAPSPSVLIAFRVLQGAFGALMIPQGFGMLKEVFAEDEMAKVFGAFGPMMGLSIARRADPRRRAGRGEPVGDRLAAGVPDQRADRHRRVRRGRAGPAADRRAPRNPARHRRDGARSDPR